MSTHLISLRGLVPTIKTDAESASVVLPSDADVIARAAELVGMKVIAVDFPKFTDGRGYSIAALLRTRLGHKAALRAVGDVLVDQLQFMARSGFDEFALRSDQDPQLALRALRSFSLRYQTAAAELNLNSSNLQLILPLLITNSHV